jgi:chromosome segregation ATPase
MHKFIIMSLGLCAPAGETPPALTGGNATITQKLAAAEARALDLQAKLDGHATEITGLKATITERDGTIKTMEGQLTEANGKLVKLEADAVAATQLLTEAQTKITGLESKEQDLSKRTAAQVKQEMAALGFPSSKLPPSGGDSEAADIPKSRAALETAMKELKTLQARNELLKKYNHAHRLN